MKLAGHMKRFQVGKQERTQNTKYITTFNSKCGDPKDHTATYKRMSVWEIIKYVRMEDSLPILELKCHQFGAMIVITILN